MPDAAALSPQAGSAGKLTLEAWVKLPALPTGGPRAVVAKGAANAYEYALRVHPSGGVELVVWAPDGATYQYVAAPAGTLAAGAWHHLAGTCENGVACRVYVDGTQRSAATAGWGPKLPGDTAAPLTVGRRGDGVQYLAAAVDEVAVYPVALSATQIRAHYAAGR